MEMGHSFPFREGLAAQPQEVGLGDSLQLLTHPAFASACRLRSCSSLRCPVTVTEQGLGSQSHGYQSQGSGPTEGQTSLLISSRPDRDSQVRITV